MTDDLGMVCTGAAIILFAVLYPPLLYRMIARTSAQPRDESAE